MANEVSGRRSQKAPRKLCIKCGKARILDEFYQNRDWKEQVHRDAWCKSCVSKFCRDRETLREYCWYNNRRWSDAHYETALKKAAYALANDEAYLSSNTPREKKLEIENQAACRAF